MTVLALPDVGPRVQGTPLAEEKIQYEGMESTMTGGIIIPQGKGPTFKDEDFLLDVDGHLQPYTDGSNFDIRSEIASYRDLRIVLEENLPLEEDLSLFSLFGN
jgi:hypothetical protein